MSRRGSFVYYLTAWVIGCFVFSLLPWMRGLNAFNSGIPRNLLFVYFITLIAGAPDVLLFAFLLRTLIRWSLPGERAGRAQSLWFWAIDGAILAFAITYLLSWAEVSSHRVAGFDHGMLHVIYQLFLAGPQVLKDSRPAIVAAAGTVVGVVLYLVDRPFEPRDAASEEDARG